MTRRSTLILARQLSIVLALLAGPICPALANEVQWFTSDDFATVVLVSDEAARDVRISAIIAAGEVDTDGTAGVAHLPEHFVYRHAFGDEFSLGEDQNAVTLATATVYAVTVPSDRVTWALGALRRTLEVPEISEVMMGVETARVRDEIATRDHGLVPMSAMRAMRGLVLPDPYNRPVLGDASSIDAAAVEAALAFHRRHYHPDRAALVVYGALSQGALSTLPGLREADRPDSPLSPLPPSAVSPEVPSDTVLLAPEGLVGRHVTILGTAPVRESLAAANRLVLFDAFDFLLRIVIHQDFGSADGRARRTARNFVAFAEPVAEDSVLIGLMAEAERDVGLLDLEEQLHATLELSLDAFQDAAMLADLAMALRFNLEDGPLGAGETNCALIERSLAGRSAPVTWDDYRDALEWLRSDAAARVIAALVAGVETATIQLETP